MAVWGVGRSEVVRSEGARGSRPLLTLWWVTIRGKSARQHRSTLVSVCIPSPEEVQSAATTIAMSVQERLEWTWANTLQLLDLFKQHPCLWHVENKNYKNKHERSVSLNAVAKELSDTMKCDVTPYLIMKKIHTLRAQYRREDRLVKASQQSGARTQGYTPKLWCYNALTFLGDGVVQDSSPLEEQETKVSSLMYLISTCRIVYSDRS